MFLFHDYWVSIDTYSSATNICENFTLNGINLSSKWFVNTPMHHTRTPIHHTHIYNTHIPQVSPKRDEVLVGKAIQYPCVSIDLPKFMMSLLKLESVKKCIKDRKLEKDNNRKFLTRFYKNLLRDKKVSARDSKIFWDFLQIQNWNEQQTTHYLVSMMDSATMYSRAKEAREFHHNFLCFSWMNLGLPLDWLALIPGALHEGKDSLANLSSHCYGLLRKQLIELHSPEGLRLPNNDIVRIKAMVGDGAEIREGTSHRPGKHWSKITPYSSSEKDFLMRVKSVEEPKLVGVSAITHTKEFFDQLKKLYDQVKETGLVTQIPLDLTTGGCMGVWIGVWMGVWIGWINGWVGGHG